MVFHCHPATISRDITAIVRKHPSNCILPRIGTRVYLAGKFFSVCTTRNQEIYERYSSSGLSLKGFAKKEGLSLSALSYHLKRAVSNKGELPPTLTELELPAAGGHIEITTPSGTVIRIPL